MWKPYTLTEDSESHLTYRYDPICSWWLYGTIAVMFLGIAAENLYLEGLAVASIFAYLILVTIPGLQTARMVKRAMRTSSVSMTGNRWSFGNPLTIRVLKTAAPDEPT